MDKNDLLAQYDRFISQIRVEVDQTFWLYNFFFVADSALLGAVFLRKLDGLYLLIAVIVGLIFSFYWTNIMERKNDWRIHWLERIRKIEESLGILQEFQMWPKDIGPRGGLWKTMFWLPKGFIVIWAIFIFFYLFVGCGCVILN